MLPSHALAAQSAPTVAVITGVTPNLVTNDSAVSLTVSGSGFVDGAVVSVAGVGSLTTTFVNEGSLTATLLSGTAPGVYAVSVTNPDGTEVTLDNALTVQQPPTHTNTPTITPTHTNTPTATPRPAYERPLVVIASYQSSLDPFYPGDSFNLKVNLRNTGQTRANNVVATFTSTDLSPTQTGGVIAVGAIAPGNSQDVNQPLAASWDLWGRSLASMQMTVAYTDDQGNSYTEKFELTLAVGQPRVVAKTPTSTPTQTPTPTQPPLRRPQLVITSYDAGSQQLQPGMQFTLNLSLHNLGNADARRVTLILGGGSAGSGPGGTPEAGGISGSGGEFTTFAPIGSSNILSLGDLDAGAALDTQINLIVNVSANPGAYPLKISLVYLDEKEASLVDDQVITLLIYSLPQLEISFYRSLDAFFAGQTGLLPLQIVNLGRKTAVLGSMRVESSGADLMNNTILIGALEPGGYYTLDANITPYSPGALELLVTVSYTDDFNQLQTITQTLSLDVQEMFMPEPGIEGQEGMAGGEVVLTPETLWQKVWRFILGLLGLDSAPPVAPPVFDEGTVTEPVYNGPPLKMP